MEIRFRIGNWSWCIQLKYAPLGLSGYVGLRVFCLESPSTTKDGFLCQLKLKYEKNKKVLSIRIRNPTTLSFEFSLFISTTTTYHYVTLEFQELKLV
jgi:hypothetical protein